MSNGIILSGPNGINLNDPFWQKQMQDYHEAHTHTLQPWQWTDLSGPN